MTANFSTFTRRATHLLAVACLSTVAAPADTIRVPGDQPTIQAGIDAAVNGDVVLIADGVYTGTGNKNLDFAGKAITVRGENGRDNCIIDCEGDGRAFYFHSGEGADSVVEGLTIRDGWVQEGSPGSAGGGGILCIGSSPTITGCTFSRCNANDSLAEAVGGGISCDQGSDAIIRDCIFRDNRAFCGGGGVAI
ncbi:MAG: right-handed parallel beta-helix repeat-containing protein, partial [Planctomycetes bacterium]|nr:right-handed parallel beta-helix repeat-containing protein [Planctomycetota bacterium]